MKKELSADDMEMRLRLNEEKIKELHSTIAGTIVEKGTYDKKLHQWEINCSLILSKLIHEADRWCELYAGDLFILWRSWIDSKLETGSLENGTFVFAFHRNGVDGKEQYEIHKKEFDHYRSVWFLDVAIVDGTITMTLHK